MLIGLPMHVCRISKPFQARTRERATAGRARALRTRRIGTSEHAKHCRHRLGIDAVGGTATGRLADCLCQSATLVSYGRLSGEPCAVQPDAFVFRDLTMRGFWLVSWFRHTPEQQRAAVVREIAGLIATGKLYAPIHATYDVSEIKEAVAAAASGGRTGKILIVPRH
jgi:NADPH:quinone reductase-like Zn-dependent oxidoreductase